MLIRIQENTHIESRDIHGSEELLRHLSVILKNEIQILCSLV